MAKTSNFEKRLAALEKTITEFFTGKPKKKTAKRKGAKKTARKSAGRKTAKRKR